MKQSAVSAFLKKSLLFSLMWMTANCTMAQNPAPQLQWIREPVEVVRFSIDGETEYVNVMGDKMPPMPEFPALTKTPGMVKGYVKDTFGHPIGAAMIGVRSIRKGEITYVENETFTDAKGYYQVNVPLEEGTFTFAGFTIDYGKWQAAVSLYPADGKLEEFTAAEGAIENFVMIPYGITDREQTINEFQKNENYYGGAIALQFCTQGENSCDISEIFNEGKFRPGTKLEIKLMPREALLGGSRAKAFVINKTITGAHNEFFINNIPIGKYRITITADNWQSVSIKQSVSCLFGIEPEEALWEADLLFCPISAEPKYSLGAGNWKPVYLRLENQ